METSTYGYGDLSTPVLRAHGNDLVVAIPGLASPSDMWTIAYNGIGRNDTIMKTTVVHVAVSSDEAFPRESRVEEAGDTGTVSDDPGHSFEAVQVNGPEEVTAPN